jgi:hypothetical protein
MDGESEAMEGVIDGASDGRSDRWCKKSIREQSKDLASDGS